MPITRALRREIEREPGARDFVISATRPLDTRHYPLGFGASAGNHDVVERELREVVEGWWRWSRLFDSRDRQDRIAARAWEWAADVVEEAVLSGGASAVELVIALANAVAEDEDDLALLGAGPIENLLSHNRPASSETIEAMDAATRQNAAVRFAVRCVWWSDDDDPEIVARFKRFDRAP